MSELKISEVKYKIDFLNINKNKDDDYIPEYNEVYKSIKRALEIDKPGYNVYLIDDFSKDKLKNIMSFIENNLKDIPPKDICYVVGKDGKSPKSIFLYNGKGQAFSKYIQEIQESYSEKTYDFYNSSDNKEKEQLLKSVQENRSELLNNMIKVAEDNGFDIRVTQSGFTFVPLKENGEAMTEKEYESLEKQEKDIIINKVTELKEEAEIILEKMKEKEEEGIQSIKELMKEYYADTMEKMKDNYRKEFLEEKNIFDFLENMCKEIEEELIDNYSMSYEDDEEIISEIIYRYNINVIVDNSNIKKPKCIYEDDPSLTNLLGDIEYENKNGVYVTDVNFIKAGSMLKANEGCLIMRINDLLANPAAYYNLKKH